MKNIISSIDHTYNRMIPGMEGPERSLYADVIIKKFTSNSQDRKIEIPY